MENEIMLKTLDEIIGDHAWIGLGVAGNQADHLNQAGETNDFKDVMVKEENAPRGMFPWFLPDSGGFLSINPVANQKVVLAGEDRVQAEPEIGLVVEFHYADSDVLMENISVLGFTVFNDFSRRIPAPKISLKKNWGAASQGMGAQFIALTDFLDIGGTIEQYRLTCYLEREGRLIAYGEDTAVSDYCYFNEQLVIWAIHQLNTQEDFGPLEDLKSMIGSSKPKFGVIGIGATRYSDFGNGDERFLKLGDRVSVIAYKASEYSKDEIETLLRENDELQSSESLLVLSQRAV